MKANAITRIVIYFVVILLLTGLLLTGLGIGSLVIDLGADSGSYLTGGGSVAAGEVRELEIEWAAGSIRIVADDVDTISFSESGYGDENYRMVYELKDGTLKLRYSKPALTVGFVSLPEKDLTITVPRDHAFDSLQLDGAALEITAGGFSAKEIELDGASAAFNFQGGFERFDCDGAACELVLNCTQRPASIDLDGAACQLELTLPDSCGFRLEMDGLSCDFKSDLAYSTKNGCHISGDEYCKISVDGMACEISIEKAAQ